MTVDELKVEISKLTPDEVCDLATFLYKLDNRYWDRQMEEAAKNGKLDRMFKRFSKEHVTALKKLHTRLDEA